MTARFQPYDVADAAVAALVTLNQKFSDRIADVFRNSIVSAFMNMDEAQFEEFAALNVPALMAWCARNELPAGTSFGARHTFNQLANQDLLVKYFREAARDLRVQLAAPSWEASPKERVRTLTIFRRLRRFLEQMENTAAFPAELTYDALFEWTGLPPGAE